MKKLEDMNLVDDFLAYSLAVHKTYGVEAARYILECILQRKIRNLTVIPQKSWYGETAGTHGGRGRMIYTIGNRCLEMPELPYEDGARTVFLYTKGTEGDPPEELQQLARYMEHSTAENVKSSKLAKLHQMVTEVKSDREVGLAYMKSYEIERMLKAESKADDLLMLLQETQEISEEERKRILRETNLRTLDNWYQEALIQNRQCIVSKSKAASILILLEDFGPVPEEAKQRVLAETDLSVLDSWLRLAKRAESLEQFLQSI